MTNADTFKYDHPMVTFAVFAYNQEQFIREAIEGAFSQTYEPLEIILSDDCSTDRTLEIMHEMASAYGGPHGVTVRSSSVNRGTLGHILDVAHISKGEYVVVAAGDDISNSDRTKTIIKTLKDFDATIASSAEIVIDANGKDKFSITKQEFVSEGISWGVKLNRIRGATAAYQTNFLKEVPPCPSGILIEDAVFEIIAHFSNKIVVSTCTPLVKYRHHKFNISVREASNIEHLEKLTCTKFKRSSKAAAFAYYAIYKNHNGYAPIEIINSYALFLYIVSGWRTMNLKTKLGTLMRAPDAIMMKWFLPRALLPWNFFITLKTLISSLRKISKSFISD